jgi:hypothetical protein
MSARGGCRKQRGSTLLEFTWVGIAMIFVMISLVSLAQGMWAYHSLAYAVREGTRYSVTHGVTCTTAPNTCGVTVANVAAVIHNAAPALSSSNLTLTFTPAAGSTITGTLSSLMGNSTSWPPSSPAGANSVGQSLSISAVYPFTSLIAVFWPGTHPQGAPGIVYLSSSSTDQIQF